MCHHLASTLAKRWWRWGGGGGGEWVLEFPLRHCESAPLLFSWFFVKFRASHVCLVWNHVMASSLPCLDIYEREFAEGVGSARTGTIPFHSSSLRPPWNCYSWKMYFLTVACSTLDQSNPPASFRLPWTFHCVVGTVLAMPESRLWFWHVLSAWPTHRVTAE